MTKFERCPFRSDAVEPRPQISRVALRDCPLEIMLSLLENRGDENHFQMRMKENAFSLEFFEMSQQETHDEQPWEGPRRILCVMPSSAVKYIRNVKDNQVSMLALALK